jgi:hypothetical protein
MPDDKTAEQSTVAALGEGWERSSHTSGSIKVEKLLLALAASQVRRTAPASAPPRSRGVGCHLTPLATTGGSHGRPGATGGPG